MKGLLLSVAIFATIALSHGAEKLHPLSDEFIDAINNKHTTWKARRNFDVNTPMSSIRQLLGVLPRKENAPKLPLKIHPEDDIEIPITFDAREGWPDCEDIIGTIRDQASCGSCWAFGAVEAMSDRICIHSDAKTKVLISAEDLNDCCTDCGDGCNGGWPDEAWLYWSQKGIVTGGLYGSKDGCKAYSITPCDHHVNGTLPACGEIQSTPVCTSVCDDGTNLVYAEDKTTGTAYSIMQSVKQIQIEIMTNGPVEADYDVYEDFPNYSSGVYQHTQGDYEGGHAIKIIGWGVEDGVDYWLAANSWNAEWGDRGYFKILRGENECGIEADIIGGLPNL
ncbi:hypothetical protein Zmor_007228 [Zophobas morio]|uniref:Peptidase C1A papain C-terminal domain-containing protein n=1 Tax=Zophobas morio TaxID=2755281 RepID=A0AA38IWB0_9CUCU|nr:hypothetical protein Zmor_007228 [Zophobas morio]